MFATWISGSDPSCQPNISTLDRVVGVIPCENNRSAASRNLRSASLLGTGLSLLYPVIRYDSSSAYRIARIMLDTYVSSHSASVASCLPRQPLELSLLGCELISTLIYHMSFHSSWNFDFNTHINPRKRIETTFISSHLVRSKPVCARLNCPLSRQRVS